MHPLLITGWAFVLPMLIGSPVTFLWQGVRDRHARQAAFVI